MYIQRKIKFSLLFEDSWRFLLIISLWSTLIIYLHDYAGLGLISMPIIPLSTLGIAVSLYLGFRSKESYERWWEARKIWGDVINKSRAFSNQVHHLLYDNDNNHLDLATKKEIIYRHIAWLYALKYQLRSTSRFTVHTKSRLFNHKVINRDEIDYIAHYLPKQELDEIQNSSNIATQILFQQGKALQANAKNGYLDTIRHTNLNDTISAFYDAQGKCERIKKTPFPRPFAFLGQVFTAVFIILLPFGFLDSFKDEGSRYLHNAVLERDYMFLMIPFTMLISWIFYMMEKVSDNMEDPFEGSANDLPLSSMVKTIEIDLRESLQDENIPEPTLAINDILH